MIDFSDRHYLLRARMEASRSDFQGDRYGVVIVKDEKVLSSAYTKASDESCLTGDALIKKDRYTLTSLNELVEEDNFEFNTLTYIASKDKVDYTIGKNVRHIRDVNELIELEFESGKIQCTVDHKFLISGINKYTKAGVITVGSSIKGGFFRSGIIKNKSIKVIGRKLITLKESVPVYDLTVPTYSNYMVNIGNNHFIVSHNCNSNSYADIDAMLKVLDKDDLQGSTLYLACINKEGVMKEFYDASDIATNVMMDYNARYLVRMVGGSILKETMKDVSVRR